MDLKVRPIYHYLAERVRAHVFLCMLPYYVECHMRQALAPVLFRDDDKATAEAQRASSSPPAKPSTQSSLAFPIAVALGADGSLYIADNGNHRIRRVGPDGIVTTVAGNGGFGSSGIALGGDGGLYIADPNNYGIRRVGPDGIITTVAGNRADAFRKLRTASIARNHAFLAANDKVTGGNGAQRNCRPLLQA